MRLANLNRAGFSIGSNPNIINYGAAHYEQKAIDPIKTNPSIAFQRVSSVKKRVLTLDPIPQKVSKIRVRFAGLDLTTKRFGKTRPIIRSLDPIEKPNKDELRALNSIVARDL